MGQDRLLQVMMEVMELEYRVQLKQDLEISLNMYGWEGMRVEALSRLSLSEVRQMLRDVAWREVIDSWREEAGSRSKLVEVRKLIEKECQARRVEVKCRRTRILTKLRDGTAGLEVETGRWQGVSREERLCKDCQSEEVGRMWSTG